jgi:hypothetical protein
MAGHVDQVPSKHGGLVRSSHVATGLVMSRPLRTRLVTTFHLTFREGGKERVLRGACDER